jgi:acetoin utilization protein AcuB
MHQPVITVSPDTPVEFAASLMAENAIGCLPVVADEEAGRLVGIITESDLFHAMVRLFGSQEPSTRLRLILPGGDATKLGQVLLMIGKHNLHLAGVLAEPVNAEGRWSITLRVRTINPEPLLRELKDAGIEVEQSMSIGER